MRSHDLVSSMGALTFHIFVVAAMSMVFDFAFLLLEVTIFVRPPYVVVLHSHFGGCCTRNGENVINPALYFFSAWASVLGGFSSLRVAFSFF